MKNVVKTFALSAVALSALSSGVALAESTYGYNSAGTGTVVATARVNVSVSVPKLILLRVGSAGATIDSLNWTVGASIPATPTVPAATGNSVGVTWDGTAPSLTTSANPAAVAVFAWSNAGTSNAVTCAATAVTPATGPTLANFTVTSGAGLAHPGANLGACGSTSFTRNVLSTGSWTYALGGTPTSWAAGTYTTQVTYTATGI